MKSSLVNYSLNTLGTLALSGAVLFVGGVALMSVDILVNISESVHAKVLRKNIDKAAWINTTSLRCDFNACFLNVRATAADLPDSYSGGPLNASYKLSALTPDEERSLNFFTSLEYRSIENPGFNLEAEPNPTLAYRIGLSSMPITFKVSEQIATYPVVDAIAHLKALEGIIVRYVSHFKQQQNLITKGKEFEADWAAASKI